MCCLVILRTDINVLGNGGVSSQVFHCSLREVQLLEDTQPAVSASIE